MWSSTMLGAWPNFIHLVLVHCQPGDMFLNSACHSPHLYTDDTHILYMAPVDAFLINAKESLSAIAAWMHSNHLQLSSDKTEFLWCSTSCHQQDLAVADSVLSSSLHRPASLVSLSTGPASACYDSSAVSSDRYQLLFSSHWSLHWFSTGLTTARACWFGYLQS